MSAYVVYGDPVFNTVEQRNEVALRVAEIARDAGLIMSGRSGSLPPGVTPYYYTEPVWPDEPGSGGTYPGIQIAYESSDEAKVEEAQRRMSDYVYVPEEPRAGSFGTWFDTSN